jgi:hypothetical protein
MKFEAGDMVDVRQAGSFWPYGRDWWFRLPMKLRRRWWTETDYGRRPCPPDLFEKIIEAFEEQP